jgi:hypothetical protein
MSCHECGFCQADLPTLENVAVDARSRGNYRIATMLDQALERCGILRENLQVNDREYLKNVSQMAKEHSSSNVSTNLLRDARRIIETSKERQTSAPIRRGMGFGAMLEASRRGTFEESHPETRAIQRIIPRNGAIMTQIERVCASRTSNTPEPPAHLGFLRMLDPDYQAYMKNGSSKMYNRTPVGFIEMLEAAFPHENPAKPDEHPRAIHRGMGFRAMLEGAAKGT